MRQKLITLTFTLSLGFGFGGVAAAVADTAKTGVSDAGANDAGVEAPAVVLDATVAPVQRLAPPSEDPTTAEVIEKGKDAAEAVEAAIAEPSVVTIAGAFAALIFAILAGLRRFAKNAVPKRTMGIVSTVGGALAAGAMILQGGGSWAAAIAAVVAGAGGLLLSFIVPDRVAQPATALETDTVPEAPRDED